MQQLIAAKLLEEGETVSIPKLKAAVREYFGASEIYGTLTLENSPSVQATFEAAFKYFSMNEVNLPLHWPTCTSPQPHCIVAVGESTAVTLTLTFTLLFVWQ